MTFTPGQKVTLVDGTNWFYSEYPDDVYPDQGGVYTVRDVVLRVGGEALTLMEIRNEPKAHWNAYAGRQELMELAFAARRFRPVVDTKHERELEAA